MIIPAHGWRPRPYQQAAWDYLKGGGRHCELIWHRRSGKDELALHHAACAMLERPATYWHMLPKANQIRTAIWDAINPVTGRRRILDAFPDEVFERRETDMFVRCKANGATWQCKGSDNYQGAIGSPPVGITYSEWAQANPSVDAYLRPILAENNGWQLRITTPRGKNHAYSTFKSAQKNPDSFAQLLTVYDTGVIPVDVLKSELQHYCDLYGETLGLSYFEQEWECSFDAAILGAYYADEFRRIDREGRIRTVPWDPEWPVHAALDLGRTDDTSIWFWQVVAGEVHIIGHYSSSGRDPDWYCGVICGRDVLIDNIQNELRVTLGAENEWGFRAKWRLGKVWLPHDAKAKTLAAKGKTVEEQFAAVFGWGKVSIVPSLSVEDGIQAARRLLRRAWIDESCEDGIESCRQYHREWDDDRKMFRPNPEHDWTSHDADALRYMAIAWGHDKLPKSAEPARFAQDRSFNELRQAVHKRKRASR